MINLKDQGGVKLNQVNINDVPLINTRKAKEKSFVFFISKTIQLGHNLKCLIIAHLKYELVNFNQNATLKSKY